MADRARTVWKTKLGLIYVAEFGEVEVTLNDTFTLGSFDSAQNPLWVSVRKLVGGGEMTCTYVTNNNVVTITGAGNNVDCVYFAYGYKA